MPIRRNDIVCPVAYTDQYQHAWRFYTQQLDIEAIEEIARERKTNFPAALTLTLDYYGSSLASELASAQVSKAFPQFLLLKMHRRNYPAACLLSRSGDGRHFIQDDRVYYILKARLLYHLISYRIRSGT